MSTRSRQHGSRERASTRDRRAAATRRPRSWRWVLPALLGVLTVLALLAYFTPVLSVRTVAVSGTNTLAEQRIRSAAGLAPGTPMMRVDTGEVRQRLESVPKVAAAEVALDWPSTVRVSVAERVPAAYVRTGNTVELIDASGVRFQRLPRPPEGVPELRVSAEADEAASRAALTVLRSLPSEVRDVTRTVVAKSSSDVRLLLSGQRRVEWGGPEHSARKAAILPPLLTRSGTVYDVISPALPTVS